MFRRKKSESQNKNTDEEWKVCQFQVRKKPLGPRPFECGLTAYAVWSNKGVTRIDCNPDMCPMFQTWKLLEEKE